MRHNLCRCCLVDSCYKDLYNEYYYAGRKEVYSEMLLDTFNITVCDNSYKRLICEECITKLRVATAFRQQILDAEETLKLSLLNNNDAEETCELKEEFDIHFDEDSNPGIEETGPDNLSAYESDDFDDKVNWDDQNMESEEGEIFVIKLEPVNENVIKKKTMKKSDCGRKFKKSTATKESKLASKSKSAKKESTQDRTVQTQKKLKENSLNLILNSNMCLFDSLKTKYKCFSCLEAFLSIEELREHSKMHSDFKSIRLRLNCLRGASYCNVDISNLECKICSVICTDLDDLKDHLISHDLKFNDEGHLLIPFKLDKDFKCVMCGQEFNSFTRLSMHMNTHYTNNVCEMCGASYISRSSLRAHINAVHTEHKCSMCSEKFHSISAKAKHMRKAHNKSRSRRYCVICNKAFLYTHMLVEHKVKEHGAKRKISNCSDCGKTFLSPQNLKIHIRSVHIRERNYPCSICELRFFTKFDQKRHEKTHLDVRTFSCNFCEGSFKSKDSLRRHLRRQHGFPFGGKK